ncbi:hypothetical protein MVEN_02006600 [Mycena venus]|uniref:Uncharacterized protein n=1 Tax=Mycena venus TaxID=2733690 RepID=A0A8H6XC13_9AGAR|nr:hypothetical protein MVEN_02006600 [Mycena venus]
MSQPMGSTSWGRGDHDSTSGAGSLRSSRLRARQSRFRSNRSFDARFSDPDSPSRRSRTPSKGTLKPRAAADEQTSLTLDASLVASSFTRDGQEADTEVQFTASLTSPNNFINFCATTGASITNGQQLTGGSCNPAPMGLIPSVNNMPSVLIFEPQKGSTIAANTTFTLELAVSNIQGGVFTSFSSNFLAAPQTLDSTGNIIGHYHVVIDELDALNSTIPTDSQKFTYFNVVTNPDVNGLITTNITNGLPEGFYRMTVTARAANHQPALVPISQHGALNDVAYFTVTASGTLGSTPASRRRAPRHVYSPHPSEAKRTVVPRADNTAQSSLTLLSSVVAQGFANAQDTPRPGQSSSLTSSNNFINFCATATLPLTNGTQTQTGFCNPAPMGVLPASTRMPTSKFTYPRNGEIFAPNAPFTVGLAVTNFATGNFGNSVSNYLAAPQQLDSSGQIQGHPQVVIEAIASSSLDVPDPRRFTFFKGMTGVADSTGVITTTVNTGLPAGFYRMSSILVTTNGAPALLPVLQHGAVDDAVYFVVADGGALPTNQTALPTSHAATSSASPSATGSSGQSGSPSAPAKKGTNVGPAVGGALAGIAVIALVIVGIWLFMRRRKRQANQAKLSVGYPVVLNSDDFGPPPPTPFNAGYTAESSMTEIRSPPSAYAPKSARGPSTRRSSVVSAAPSYHTQI